MTIYSKEQLIEKVEALSDKEKIGALMYMVYRANTSVKKETIINAINNTDRSWSDLVKIADGRLVKSGTIKAICGSGMMGYVKELIQAALDGSPKQTQDIMLVAMEYKGGDDHFFYSVDGIEQKHKRDAGIILTLAGFNRVSKYMKGIGSPRKPWVRVIGTGSLSVDERVQMAHANIDRILNADISMLDNPITVDHMMQKRISKKDQTKKAPTEQPPGLQGYL